jgi:hypothetical protein
MGLVLGLSTLPLWHVQRAVETNSNLNNKCFIKFPKGEKNSTFHNNTLREHFFNVETKPPKFDPIFAPKHPKCLPQLS